MVRAFDVPQFESDEAKAKRWEHAAVALGREVFKLSKELDKRATRGAGLTNEEVAAFVVRWDPDYFSTSKHGPSSGRWQTQFQVQLLQLLERLNLCTHQKVSSEKGRKLAGDGGSIACLKSAAALEAAVRVLRQADLEMGAGSLGAAVEGRDG